MADVQPASEPFEVTVETLIVGAGAGGLVTALSAREAGQNVLVLEADPVPSGSTALSAGLIPAAGTAQQIAAGIDDSADMFAADIQAKAKGENDPALVARLAQRSAEVINWLTDRHHLPFSVVDDFDYPGHSARRMHGLPSRAGRELVDALAAVCAAEHIDIVCEARVTTLFTDGREVVGIGLTRPDGTTDRIGCTRLILACNGFGGNRARVARHMPDIKDALWFGHDGNRGEALDWAEGLGAQTQHLGAYQGHGNVAHPHGILITWAVITEGGVQVNRDGKRFWNEAQGYSEAARAVMAQPGGEAFAIFDDRIAGIARQFADFQQAEEVGAIVRAKTPEALAAALGLPEEALAQTLADIPNTGKDAYGRDFGGKRLQAPFCGVRVTGALFHTQGGVRTDAHARVLRDDGNAFDSLYAVGGAAVGVSGRADYGYLSGNGLLAAVVLGRIAGCAGVSSA